MTPGIDRDRPNPWTICNECGLDIQYQSPVYCCNGPEHATSKFFCTLDCHERHIDREYSKKKAKERREDA